VLIFCSGRPRDVKKLADILNLFRLAIGMVINPQKSSLTLIGLDEEVLDIYISFFFFPTLDLSLGIKYMGFQLKANKYCKEDWWWILEKIEKILNIWSYEWLSRVDKLTLTKSVLESIPVYWMPLLAWIPKGILEKVCHMCFQFIWLGSKYHFTLPWENWELLARPKALVGWGLKNIFIFSKSLATKLC
jgi:hypothetical protein